MLHALPRVLANPQNRQKPLFNLSQLPARARDVFPTNVTPSPSPLAYKIAQNGMTCLSPENEESFVISPPPKGKEKRGLKSAVVVLLFVGMRLPSSCSAVLCGMGHHFFPRWKKGIEYLSTSVEEAKREAKRGGREGEKVAVILCGTRASERAIAFSSSWILESRRRHRQKQ